MAGVLQHLRSSTLNKRPNPASMVDGQLAINYASGSPGAFFKDTNGNLVKVGPVHVGSSAPNVSPASGGTAGNSLGEQWLDTSGGTYVFKIWDGGAWRSEAGEFVNVTGDTMTGALGIIAGSASTPGLFFSGDANSGLYSPGADQLAISTSGAQRLVVDASGNVGVAGTPTARFTVVGSAGSVEFASDGATLNFTRNAANYIQAAGASATLSYRSPVHIFTGASLANEFMRLDSSGRLGVGASSVSELLHIKGGSSAGLDPTVLIANGAPATSETASVDFGFNTQTADPDVLGRISTTITNRTSGAQASTLAFSVASSGSLSPRMTLTGTGLGIGTTSPNAPLCVNGLPPQAGIISAVAASGGRSLALSDNINCSLYVTHLAGGALIGTDSGNAIRFATNGFGSSDEKARIDSSGRLLVGTSSSRSVLGLSPSLQLEAAAGYVGPSFTSNANDSSGSYLHFTKSRGTSLGSNTVVANNDNLGTITFNGTDGSAAVEAARISVSVDGTPGTNDMPGRLVFSTTADGASSPTERMRITSNGFVLIGKSDTASAAETVGYHISDAAVSYQTTDGNEALNLSRKTSNGSLIVFRRGTNTAVGSISVTTTATAYNTSSDYRLKENVTAVTDGITRLQQLKPSRFNFKADPSHTVDGFLAHEVQTIVPEAITGEKDAVDDEGNPEYQGIDQSKLVPLLTAALQEAIGEIESLKARLTAAGI